LGREPVQEEEEKTEFKNKDKRSWEIEKRDMGNQEKREEKKGEKE
jgi:hypothetical protein